MKLYEETYIRKRIRRYGGKGEEICTDYIDNACYKSFFKF